MLAVRSESKQPTNEARSQGLVVIADSGSTASLVMIGDPKGSIIGTRFQYRGETWEIRYYRSSAKAYVAKPVIH